MDVVEAERADAGRAAMDSILSQLSALSAGRTGTKVSAQQGTDQTTDQRRRESSICEAIYNLGNAASPGTRMGSFLPGTGRFVETSVLGEGSHGVVAKARDSVTGETVAVKTLHPKPLYFAHYDDEKYEYYIAKHKIPHCLLREACFMAACRGHPSLVRLSAVGGNPQSSSYFLVMEHVGPSLDHVLRHERGGEPFPEDDVRRMMWQVLRGAKAMHDRGVVHRAINSSNILVGDGGGGVKIGDFGKATSVSETDVRYSVIWSHYTPEYLLHAPGAVNSELIDSWSMGCLMLELLTGEDHFRVAEEEEDSGSEGQLYRVFDVLGVPGKRTMKAVKPQYRDIARKVQQWRARQRRVGKQQRSRLRELVPCEVLSDAGFEVLQGLLMINPKKRLTAAAALQHPWFASEEHDTDDHYPDDYPADPGAHELPVGALEDLFNMSLDNKLLSMTLSEAPSRPGTALAMAGNRRQLLGVSTFGLASTN
ncbi:hypothetical protein EJB05_42057, partial [Eragrostis curvula]